MMNDTRGQSSEEKGGKREWGWGLFTIHTPQCSFLFFSSILDQRHKDTMWTFHRHVVIEHWVDTSGLMLVSFYILVCRTSWRNSAYVNSLSLFYTIHPLVFLGIFSLFGDCVFGLRILLVNASLPPPEQNPISPKLFARHCLFAWLTRRLGTAHTQESSRRWVPHYWARLLILLFPLDIVSCFPSSFEGIPWWYGAWISKRCTECSGATPLDTHFGLLADPPCPYPVEEWWRWCERNFQGRKKQRLLVSWWMSQEACD